MDNLKTQHFNVIKKILNNENNNEIHLPQLEKIVENYGDNFGKGKLYYKLKLEYLSEFARVLFLSSQYKNIKNGKKSIII